MPVDWTGEKKLHTPGLGASGGCAGCAELIRIQLYNPESLYLSDASWALQQLVTDEYRKAIPYLCHRCRHGADFYVMAFDQTQLTVAVTRHQ